MTYKSSIANYDNPNFPVRQYSLKFLYDIFIIPIMHQLKGKKMKRLLFALFIFHFVFAQTSNDEFRATWVITWEHISSSDTPEQGKERIRNILDDHVEANMNAVLFQVRQSGTSYYNSSFEPWGYYAGYDDPGYDPLEYAVQEAHQRGLELHAWFNAFQASSTYEGTPAYEHPEWVCRDQDGIPMNEYRALSPGLEAVRNYTLDAAMEIVNNYDIDGIHLDYIRWNEYSNSGRTSPTVQQEESALDGMISEDQIEALQNDRSGRYLYDVDHPFSNGVPSGYSSWEEWWRWGVTEFVSMLHDSIQDVKPSVRLSTAVLGKYNWSGWQGYNIVYQDAALWYNNGYVDQLTPMHYHWTSSTGFMGMLVNDCPNCWSDYIQEGITNERIYSVGPGSYILHDNGVWNHHASIINACRNVGWVKGFQFFSYGTWNFHDYWSVSGSTFFSKNTKIPETISDLSISSSQPILWGSQQNSLTYQFTISPSDSSHPYWFVIYRSPYDTINTNNDEIIDIIFADSTFTITDLFHGTQDYNGQYRYYVTQANRFWKESSPSNIFLSDSIPSYPPMLISSYPLDIDTVGVNISPVFHFSKTMITDGAYDAITVTPDPGHNLVWSNFDKSVTVNFFGNLDYNTSYTITLTSNLTDVNGVSLDGNGDGIPGDGFTLQFLTFEEDILGPMIIDQSFVSDSPTDIGQVITVVFDEEVQSTSLNSTTVQLTRNGINIPYGDAFSTLNENSTYTIRPADGNFSSNSTYQILFTDEITDINGNPMDSALFDFSSEPMSYDEIAFIDEFDNVSNWWQPSGSGSTTGILSGTIFETSSTISIPGTYPRRSAKLSYVWDTTAPSHLLREYCAGGVPHVMQFDTSYTLECYIYGDGSHNYFRFCVDDNLPGSGTEVSEWVEIDWIGWKLITWDLGSDPVGSWIGNGILEGTLRNDSFQMTYNSAYGVDVGAIYFDDYRITKKMFNLSSDSDIPVLPEDIVLHQNYPNPFNPSTEIDFALKNNGYTSLIVYDILGRKVKTLMSNYAIAGNHTINWNSSDEQGKKVASGLYFCQLKSMGVTKTIRMIVTK